MRKITQIQMNEQTLVALCDDGTLWQLARDGSGWYSLPDIGVVKERNQEEPINLSSIRENAG
jgi:hypothetical protein